MVVASLLALFVIRALAVRDEDSTSEAAGQVGGAAAEASVLGRLGHRVGDIVFDQFELLEYRGFAPIKKGVPPLYPGHWGPGTSAQEDLQAKDPSARATALLESGQEGELSHKGFPGTLTSEYTVDANAGKKGLLGGGAFGEAWLVKLVKEKDSDMKYVLKLLTYDGKIPTSEEVQTDKGRWFYWTLMYKECQFAQRIQSSAESIEDSQVKKYAKLFVTCHKYNGPTGTKQTWSGREEDKDKPAYLLLEDCGPTNLEQKLTVRDKYDRIIKRLADWVSVETTAWVIREIAKGLRYLQETKLIHRDLKTENVMVVTDEFGRNSLKIIDFGLMLEAHKKGPWGGSPLTVPPEQMQHGYKEDITPTAFDMFSFHNVILVTLTTRLWDDMEKEQVSYWRDTSRGGRARKMPTNNFGSGDLSKLRGWIKNAAKEDTSPENDNPVLRQLMETDLKFNSKAKNPKCTDKDFLTLWVRMGDSDPERRPMPDEVLQNAWVIDASGLDPDLETGVEADILTEGNEEFDPDKMREKPHGTSPRAAHEVPKIEGRLIKHVQRTQPKVDQS